MHMIDLTGAMPSSTEKLFLEMSTLPDIKDWTLVGGTALAIHIKHRTSEDLDFFINKNRINQALKNKIERMINSLKEIGYISNEIPTEDDDSQLDFIISGVKVSFCITSSIDLKKDTVSYNNMDIASEEAIAAMKLFTLLKHRTKSRDFYDIKSLIDDKGYSLESLLENMQEKFPKFTPKSDYIIKRFLTRKLNSDDEGFSSLKLKKQETFSSLRKYFKDLIYEKLGDDAKILGEISSSLDNILLLKYKDRKFDINNSSLAMKLIEINELVKYEQLVVNLAIDPSYKNIEGVTVLDYLAEIRNSELFDKTLNLIPYIPEGITERLKNMTDREDFIESIEKHKIINRCIGKTPEKIEEILDSKGVDKNLFLKHIEDKKKLLPDNDEDIVSQEAASLNDDGSEIVESLSTKMDI